MKPEFRKTRYTVITRIEDGDKEPISYCSMGNQKFYVEDIDCLDRIKKSYVQVAKLQEAIVKQGNILSLETKLEVKFK